MDSDGIERCLTRIAYEILEKTRVSIILCWWVSALAALSCRKASEKISAIENTKIPLGILDITLYRDDITKPARKPADKQKSPSIWKIKK